MQPDTLVVYYPDDRPFSSFVELDRQRQQAEQKAERLAAELRELGIDPDSL